MKKFTMIRFTVSVFTLLFLSATIVFFMTSSDKLFMKHSEFSLKMIAQEKSASIDTEIKYAEGSIRLLSHFVSSQMTERELKNPNAVFEKYTETLPFDFVEYITACGVSGKNPLIQLSSKFKEVVKMDVGNIMHQAFIPDINYFLPLIQDSKNIGKEYAYADIEISNCGNGNLQNLRIESVSNDKRGEDSIWINGDSLCITDRRRFLLQIDCSNFTQEKTCPIHICAKFDDCNNHHYRQEFTFNVEYPTEPHYKTHNTSIIRKTIEVHADPVIQC